MGNTETKRILGFGLLEGLKNLGYKISVEGQENISEYNQYPHLPSVIYYNHVTLVDPAVMTLMIKKYLPSRLSNPVIFPVAVSYPDSKLQADQIPIYKKAVEIAKNWLGFQMIPIVQSYRFEDPTLTDEAKKELIKRSRELSEEYIKQLNTELPKSATVVIAPEGSRGPKLQPAEIGLGNIAKKLINFEREQAIFGATFLPVGLVYSDRYSPKSINLNPLQPQHIAVKVGKPLTIAKIREESSAISQITDKSLSGSVLYTNYLMTKLRDLLPEEMWGVYHPDKLKDTLSGRYKLQINPDTNRAGVYDRTDNSFV